MTGFYSSPVGLLRIEITDNAVTGICLADSAQEEETACPLTEQCKRELEEYFSGTRTQFSFPVALKGTELRQKILKELQNIPYGTTASYSEIALRACGSSSYARAVASAAHKNPLLLAVPCHRMIGKDGSLVGFAAGLPAKKYLLELERSHP